MKNKSYYDKLTILAESAPPVLIGLTGLPYPIKYFFKESSSISVTLQKLKPCRNKYKNKRIKRKQVNLRIVYKDDISSFDELLTKDKSFIIHHRDIQSLAIELYKSKHEISPLIIRNIFTARPTIARNLRTQSDFPLPQINTVHYGKDSLRYFGSIVWNMIPADIKNITTFKGFKEK